MPSLLGVAGKKFEKIFLSKDFPFKTPWRHIFPWFKDAVLTGNRTIVSQKPRIKMKKAESFSLITLFYAFLCYLCFNFQHLAPTFFAVFRSAIATMNEKKKKDT